MESKVINLDSDFAIFKDSEIDKIKVERFTFPGGERHVKLERPLGPESIPILFITHRINNSDDLIDLCLLMEIIKRARKTAVVSLFLPYFPGARQDRITSNVEPVSVKVYSDIINSLGFDVVTIADSHSAGVELCLRQYNAISLNNFYDKVFYNVKDTYLICPDVGAYKKTEAIAARYGLEVVQGFKHRDLSTGKLSGFSIEEKYNLNRKRCIIVDDICDGGGTFLGLASVLLGKYDIPHLELVVTHGIFSKGFTALLGYYDRITFTDSIANLDLTTNFGEAPPGRECLMYNGFKSILPLEAKHKLIQITFKEIGDGEDEKFREIS